MISDVLKAVVRNNRQSLHISEQTFYRWKSKYTGLEVDQVRQMKQCEMGTRD